MNEAARILGARYNKIAMRGIVTKALDEIFSECTCGSPNCDLRVTDATDWPGVYRVLRKQYTGFIMANRMIANTFTDYVRSELGPDFAEQNSPMDWMELQVITASLGVVFQLYFEDLANGKPPVPADKYLQSLRARVLAHFDRAAGIEAH